MFYTLAKNFMKEAFCMNMFHCYKILQRICFKIINLKQVHLYKATDNLQLLVLFYSFYLSLCSY